MACVVDNSFWFDARRKYKKKMINDKTKSFMVLTSILYTFILFFLHYNLQNIIFIESLPLAFINFSYSYISFFSVGEVSGLFL